MFSYVLKSFKIQKLLYCFYKYFLLKGKSSFNSNGFNIVVLLMGGKGWRNLKTTWFFSYMFECVDVVVHFVM